MPSTESEDSKWLRVKTFAAVCGSSPFCITISTLDVTILQSQPQKSFFFCSCLFIRLSQFNWFARRAFAQTDRKENELARFDCDRLAKNRKLKDADGELVRFIDFSFRSSTRSFERNINVEIRAEGTLEKKSIKSQLGLFESSRSLPKLICFAWRTWSTDRVKQKKSPLRFG